MINNDSAPRPVLYCTQCTVVDLSFVHKMATRGLTVFSHNIMDGRKLETLLGIYRKQLPPLVDDRGLGIACLQVSVHPCCLEKCVHSLTLCSQNDYYGHQENVELPGKPLDTAASAIASTLDDMSSKQASSWTHKRRSNTRPRRAGASKLSSGWQGTSKLGSASDQTRWKVTEDRETDPRLATVYDSRRFKLVRQR